MLKSIFILSAVVCLLEGKHLEGRIAGGHPTTIESYPYLATIWMYTAEGAEIFVGTGTILNETTVLTLSFSDFKLPNSFSVRAGNLLLNETVQEIPVKSFNVRPTASNENADMSKYAGVVLLSLSKRLSFTQQVGKVSLPPVTALIPKVALLTLVGWGSNCVDGKNTAPGILQEVLAPHISDDICSSHTHNDQHQLDCAMVYNNNIKKPCQEDAGGPVIYDEKLYGVVVNVTAFCYNTSEPCPGVFREIYGIRGWLVKEGF